MPEIRYLIDANAIRDNLAADVEAGLTATPKSLPPKYFYDDRGSQLFDEITRLEEYYPTNAERGLLKKHSHDIARAAEASVLLELGSGSSEKTRWLLDAMAHDGTLTHYVPVDVSDGALRSAADNLDGLDVDLIPVAADFESDLGALPAPGARLIAFLGGTIGNFTPPQRSRFLSALAGTMRRGEHFLLGIDLVKDPGRLVRAYDDARGVTAEFNSNVLQVINRELDADFEVEAFEHVAIWDADNEWIEMRLRATRPMTVTIRGLDLKADFAADELMRTEISAKFRRNGIERELATAGLKPTNWWTDGDYALTLAKKDAE